MAAHNGFKRLVLCTALACGGWAQHAAGQVRPVDEHEASEIALGHLTGEVLLVLRERDLDRRYFDVLVRAEDGLVYDVDVAADDGRVLAIVLVD